MQKVIKCIQKTLVTVLNPRTLLSALFLCALSACYLSTSSKEHSVQVPSIKANCQYVDTTTLGMGRFGNPYNNGYQLIRETYESSATPSVTTYQYNPTSQTVEVLKELEGTDVRYRTTQYLDSTGRITGGDHVGQSPLLRLGHSYQIAYDDDGRIVSYDINGVRKFDFHYEQGRLIEISHSNQELNETKEFNYDNSGNLVSIYERDINLTYFYTCNELNQIISLHTERDGTMNGYYTIDYDENGNLSELKNHTSHGIVINTRTFEYRASTTSTLNHWQLRNSMGLIPRVEQLVH